MFRGSGSGRVVISTWLIEQRVRSSNPVLAIWVSEIGYLLLLSCDMTEISLKRRKILKQPNKLHVCSAQWAFELGGWGSISKIQSWTYLYQCGHVWMQRGNRSSAQWLAKHYPNKTAGSKGRWRRLLQLTTMLARRGNLIHVYGKDSGRKSKKSKISRRSSEQLGQTKKNQQRKSSNYDIKRYRTQMKEL